ncbi:MAG: hypothetical protein NVS4B3_22540 [Gemmatimonadaceae bacterium]
MTDVRQTHAVDCLGAMKELWDYLDGEVTETRRQAIRAHLERCAPCFEHSEFEQHFLDALAASRNCKCAPARLRDRIIRALEEAGYCRRSS